MKSSWKLTSIVGILSLVLISIGCSGNKDIPVDPKPPEVVEKAPDPEPTDIETPEPPKIVDKTPELTDLETDQASERARKEGLIGDIFFAFDKYDLQAEARERLAKNATFLKSEPSFVVTIQGHCDERGTNDYNIALGDRRANAAKEYLGSLGVPASRIQTVSYGEERPTCTQANESCWGRNRRGEFHLTGKVGGQ